MIEEVDLEEELRKLDIKDYDEDDSELTPTNTRTSRILPPTVFDYPHGTATSHFGGGDDTESICSIGSGFRSNSSLSWSEDEFEGEATRIVTKFFHQLDDLMYGNLTGNLAWFPGIQNWRRNSQDNKNIIEENKNPPLECGENSFTQNEQNYPYWTPKSEKTNYECQFLQMNSSNCYEISEKNNPNAGKATEDSSDLVRFNGSMYDTDLSYSLQNYTNKDFPADVQINSVTTPEPSSALITECCEWTNNFPHLRVTGVGINLYRYEKIFSKLTSEMCHQSEFENMYEETILSHGVYEDETSLNFSTKNCSEKERKKSTDGPSSRICSSTDDPAVLKELVLIKVFDHIWPNVARLVEPLLNVYSEAMAVSTISSHLSKSLSRNSKQLLPSLCSNNVKPLPMPNAFEFSGTNRPLSNKRPPSALYRLSGRTTVERPLSIESVTYEAVDLTQKERLPSPLIGGRVREGRVTALPSLAASADSRPLSSKVGKRFMAPTPSDVRRPLTTSSFNRTRLNGALIRYDSPATIEEIERPLSQTGARMLDKKWSRHHSVLPGIRGNHSILPSIADRKTRKSSTNT